MNDKSPLALNQRLRTAPDYFIAVERESRDEWQTLEDRPRLAGPWKQLFLQLQQSTRHVLSELLQNADDAGASSATARIEDGAFIFEHNGADFDHGNFSSLCQFGCSNKRTLHTIGFRGIGFKSTFSLGDPVYLTTPTLSVYFERTRFTLPVWNNNSKSLAVTQIRVPIQDSARETELRKNFDEWAKSPASLLFFRHIAELEVDGKRIAKQSLSDGPVPNSSWVSLTSNGSQKVLVVRSELEAFPVDALEEIRQERGVEDYSLPPCQVELVLGLQGEQRIFAVLPTEVTLQLPISCNAPFVQDPARTGVKSPSRSATNRWLLSRIGELAATTMHMWLLNGVKNRADGCEAYRLLPHPSPSGNSFDTICSTRIVDQYKTYFESRPVLLTTGGQLAPKGACCVPPKALYRIWDSDTLAFLFSGDQALVLAPEVSDASRTTLAAWNWIKQISISQSIERLKATPPPPRPRDWEKLIELWQFVETHVTDDLDNEKRRSVRIIPVEGSEELFPTNLVIRLPTDRGVRTTDDLKFLLQHINQLAIGWTEKVDKIDAKQAEASAKLRAVLSLLDKTGFNKADPWHTILGTATSTVFSQKSVIIAEAVRLAHIHAHLNCNRSDSLHYVNRGNRLIVTNSALNDRSGRIEAMLPSEWAAEHLLLTAYFNETDSCSSQTWTKWFDSGSSGAMTFPRLMQNKRSVSKSECEAFLRSRAVPNPPGGSSRRYQNEYLPVEISDYDFEPVLVNHWVGCAKEDSKFWSILLRCFLELGQEDLSTRCEAKVEQSRYSLSAIADSVPAQWVYRLRATKCLPDTHGVLREPAELLSRNSETEALVGVEPFVLHELDTEPNRPVLKALGVRARPASAEGLLQRIRALATVKNPPVDEVVKWFIAIDRQLHRSDGDDRAQIIAAFQNEPISLTSDARWVKLGNVFRKPSDDDLPGVTVLHPSASHLPMWEQFGVPEKPTEDLMIAWVKALPVGTVVDPTDLKRLKSYLKRFAEPIWQDCGKWLSLDNSWQPLSDFRYRIEARQKSALDNLFPRYKALTADLGLLPDSASHLGQDTLADLLSAIELRLDKEAIDLTQGEKRDWILALGESLKRFTSDDSEQVARVREVADRLSRTVWIHLPKLNTTPYIDGVPAGEPRSADCAWEQFALLVREKSPAKYADAVVQQLSRPFGNKLIADAIRYCIDRSSDPVDEYLSEKFDLSGRTPAEAADDEESPDEVESDCGGIVPATEPSGADGPTDTEDQEPSTLQQPIPATAPSTDTASNKERKEPINRGNRNPYVGSRNDGFPRTNGPNRETRNSNPNKPAGGPTLMTEFARIKNFKWSDADKCYVRKDGCTIVAARGPFHWEWLDRSGKVTWRMWVAEQSLQSGVEFDTEVWVMLKQRPGMSALVLRENKTPKFVPASDLIRMTENNQVGLFPATYRLRIKSH